MEVSNMSHLSGISGEGYVPQSAYLAANAQSCGKWELIDGIVEELFDHPLFAKLEKIFERFSSATVDELQGDLLSLIGKVKKNLLPHLKIHFSAHVSSTSSQQDFHLHIEKKESSVEAEVSAPVLATPGRSVLRPFTRYLFSELLFLLEQGKLYPMVLQRRQKIAEEKETWRPFIEAAVSGEDAEIYADIHRLIVEGTLNQASGGQGGAYYLCDDEGTPRFVVKPADEDIYCLNNHKGWAAPFDDSIPSHRVRAKIPLYQSAKIDLLASNLATHLGMADVTPKTIMAILYHDGFHDVVELLDSKKYDSDEVRFLLATIDKEKLCSAQEFVQGAKSVWSWMYDGDSDERCIDYSSFEDANIFMWSTFDGDGHGENILVYEKATSSEGLPVYGFKKIDNDLGFPTSNQGHNPKNILISLEAAHRPLSNAAKEKILSFDVAPFVDRLHELGCEDRIEAFLERMTLMKLLAKKDGITIREFDTEMRQLCTAPLVAVAAAAA